MSITPICPLVELPICQQASPGRGSPVVAVLSDVPIPADNRILFYRRDRAAYDFLSNFAATPVQLDGVCWPTVEHYYQAQKSFDPAYRQTILAARRPGLAKLFGADPGLPRRRSRLSWFRRNGQLVRADWPEMKRVAMRAAITAKFDQHPDLAAALCATGDALIVEDTPVDAFWGSGSDGNGSNWAGRILMEVRERLRERR